MATHRPVDVLTDRKADSFAEWLTAHSGTTTVCRDRAGAYVEGARTGAPTRLRSSTAGTYGTTWPKPWRKPLPPITVAPGATATVDPNPSSNTPPRKTEPRGGIRGDR